MFAHFYLSITTPPFPHEAKCTSSGKAKVRSRHSSDIPLKGHQQNIRRSHQQRSCVLSRKLGWPDSQQSAEPSSPIHCGHCIPHPVSYIKISDRLGLFSPGPPRLQVREVEAFMAIVGSIPVALILSAILAFICRLSGLPKSNCLKTGALYSLCWILCGFSVLWIVAVSSLRCAPGYDWGDWKLREDRSKWYLMTMRFLCVTLPKFHYTDMTPSAHWASGDEMESFTHLN